MGAGILPITTHCGNVYVLLGQERYGNKWSDFGGSTNPGETFIKTALREGEEELNGILGSGTHLANIVKNNYIAEINNGDRYSSFIFKIKYDNQLPNYFNNNNIFMENNFINRLDNNNINYNGFFEKRKIKWFTLDEIEKDYSIFRPHYIPILKRIVTNKYIFRDNIIQFKTTQQRTQRRQLTQQLTQRRQQTQQRTQQRTIKNIPCRVNE